jgi:hypothetical protein
VADLSLNKQMLDEPVALQEGVLCQNPEKTEDGTMTDGEAVLDVFIA